MTVYQNDLLHATRTEYTYDAFDRRISQTTSVTSNGTTFFGTDFKVNVYNGSQLLMVTGGGTNIADRLLPGPGGQTLAVDRVSGGGVPPFGNPIEGGAQWLLTDHLGSVRRVLDADGDVVGDINYSAFGKVTSTANPDTLNAIVGYTGQVFDVETGLHYFKARYYDPASGRFLSEDPSGLAGGDANLYRYVGNNPINATDPTGLAGRFLTSGGGNSYSSSSLFSPYVDLSGGRFAVGGSSSGGGSSSSLLGYSAFSGLSGGGFTNSFSGYSTGSVSTPVSLGRASPAPASGGSGMSFGPPVISSSPWVQAVMAPSREQVRLPSASELANPLAYDANGNPRAPLVSASRELGPISQFFSDYDSSFEHGNAPNLLTRAVVGALRPFVPSVKGDANYSFADGQQLKIMDGGVSNSDMAMQAAAILPLAKAGSALNAVRTFADDVLDNFVQSATGLPIGPSTIRIGRAPSGVPKYASEVTTGRYLASEAPQQVQPGVRVLTGQKIESSGIAPRVQPWTAHYDEYGRLMGRTDFNAANPAVGIPDVHYHTYQWAPGMNPLETGSHIPGEFVP